MGIPAVRIVSLRLCCGCECVQEDAMCVVPGGALCGSSPVLASV